MEARASVERRATSTPYLLPSPPQLHERGIETRPLLNDPRHGFRMLLRTPLLSLVAALTIGRRGRDRGAGISPATVKRDWVLARAWLYRELALSSHLSEIGYSASPMSSRPFGRREREKRRRSAHRRRLVRRPP